MTFSPELEARFEKLLNSYPPGRQRSAVVPMLLYAQDEVGSVTRELIEEVAHRCGVSTLQVDEVIGYYSMLHRKPLGKYHVQVCTNIACQALGGEELLSHASKTLRLANKQVSPDGLISLEEVECIGACSWAPAIQVNYDFFHSVTPDRFDQIIEALRDGSYGRQAS
jgi:NADH-quinone oxidoreductase subunit E